MDISLSTVLVSVLHCIRLCMT